MCKSFLIMPIFLLWMLRVCNGLAEHPRLILTSDRINFISTLPSSTDPFAVLFVSRTIQQSESSIQRLYYRNSVNENSAPDARYIVQDVYNLAVTSALTKNSTYSLCGCELFLRAALNPSWDTNNSIPQLNTGEMLHIIGLAFDWFYDLLTPENRSDVVKAISEHLLLIKDALSSTPPSWSTAFVNSSSNWNMVILSGTIIASLAIEGESGEPDWNVQLRKDALSNILAYSAPSWGPSGAWPEGLNYGGYTARYMTPLIACLLSSTGNDAGLRSLPGVLQSPRWLIANMAPTLPFPVLWDYFDSRKTPETIASYLAIAVWANDAPAAAGIKRLLTSLAPSIPLNDTETTAWNAPLACLYYSTLGSIGEDAQLPVLSNWDGPITAAMRSSWMDNATFIAFKGHNTTSLWAHTHLDGGSFVFVTQGQYFAQDLSSDEYSAPGYFSPTRFNLYRTNVSGHNTISFAGRNPLCKVISTYSSDCPPSPMTVFNITGESDDVSAFSVVNLTEGFVRAPILGVQRVERGFIVGKEQSQLVTVDEVDFNQTIPTLPLWWTMHTVANISIQNSTLLTLTTWNTTAIIKISILNSSNCLDAQFTISPLNLVPPLLPSPGINVIRIVAPASSCKRLVVAIGEDPPSFHYSSIRPISEWRENGPFS